MTLHIKVTQNSKKIRSLIFSCLVKQRLEGRNHYLYCIVIYMTGLKSVIPESGFPVSITAAPLRLHFASSLGGVAVRHHLISCVVLPGRGGRLTGR